MNNFIKYAYNTKTLPKNRQTTKSIKNSLTKIVGKL